MTDEKAPETSDAPEDKRPYPSKLRFENVEPGPLAEVSFARPEAEPEPPKPEVQPEPVPEPEEAAIIPAPRKLPADIVPIEIDYSKYEKITYQPVEPTMKLRGVQVEAIDAFIGDTQHRRKIIVLPTGCGKTVTGLAIAGRVNGRVLWIAHRDELIEQPADEVDKRFPNLEYGVEKGGVFTGVGKRLVIASIQTLNKLSRLKPILEGAPFSVVIYDECHHATSIMARKLLTRLGCFKDDGPILLGLTATIERSDKTSLGEVFEALIYSVSIKKAIEMGFLVPPKPIKVPLPINLKAIKIVNGDFAAGDLERELARTNAAQATASAILANCGTRKTIAFCASVNQAQRTAESCKDLGIKAAWVSGEMAKSERRARLHQFSIGEVQVLTCSDLLVEGYDERSIGAVVIAKPTRSQGRYTQMAGRGLRTCEHKVDCLLIDIVGASDLGMVTAEILLTPDKKKELKKRAKKTEDGGDPNMEWQRLAAYLNSATVDTIEHGELVFARASDDMIVTVAKDRELVILRRVSLDPDLWQVEHRGIVFSPFPLSLQESISVFDSMIEEFGGGAKPGSPEWDVATSAPAPPKGFNPADVASSETTKIAAPESLLPIAFQAPSDAKPGMSGDDLAESINLDILNTQAMRFCSGLKLALRSCEIHLLDEDRGPPRQPYRWGWKPRTTLTANADLPIEGGGPMVGWVRGDTAFIDADTCVPIARRALLAAGETSTEILVKNIKRHLGTRHRLFKGLDKTWVKVRSRDIDQLVGRPDVDAVRTEFVESVKATIASATKLGWKQDRTNDEFVTRALCLDEVAAP